MTTPDSIATEVSQITADLIEVGLCVDQNFPSQRTLTNGLVEIGFGRTDSLAITLKNIPYAESYGALKDERSFNVKLIDGGLLQFLYTFRDGELKKHRLAFFPSPDLLEYQNNPDVYELDEMYGDVLDRNIVTTPIRFDFDCDLFIEVDHPMSHMTIGQYKNCRIPVTGPISPFLFVTFVLRSFYNTPFRNFVGSMRAHEHDFANTISPNEEKLIHIRVSNKLTAA